MTPRDLIDRADIADVWRALGGPELRHGRGQAFWRGGSNYNVAIDEAEGVWYDHARGAYGGILDLIEIVLECDRRAAVRWLENHLNVTLDDNRTLTPSGRRQWAERRRWAKREAERLTEWREQYLADLRQDRNDLWDAGRGATALGYRLMTEGADDSPAWAVVWRHCLDDLEGDRIDCEIERVRAMHPREVIAFREALTGERVAA